MFGLGPFDIIKIAAGVALGASLAWFPAKWAGKAEGRAEARVEALEAVIEQTRERSLTNEEVRNMDDADLCAAIGGVFADGKCR